MATTERLFSDGETALGLHSKLKTLYMRDSLEFPRLRWPLDIRLERAGGQEVLLILCPLGVSREPLALVSAVGPIISQFNGEQSLSDIAKNFSKYGVTESIVKELVNILYDKLFLDSPRFRAAESKVRSDFLSSDVRESALAGVSYPATPKELTLELDRYLARSNGVVGTVAKKLVGVVSPHIDYRRGGEVYGSAYNRLRGNKHDLYLLIGTSHQYSKNIFHLSAKHFKSPLGVLQCNQSFVRNLADRYGRERSFEDEILHRREHSLELQVPFLRHVFRGGEIVPILVGGFFEILRTKSLPSDYEPYESFVSALVESCSSAVSEGRRICIIAGVDIAHVGRLYGDDSKLSEETLRIVRERDERYLQSILNQDKGGLFEHIAEDGDARRVCGYPTMYTVIDLLDRLGIRYQGELVEYRQAVDYESDSAVSFASLALYENLHTPV